MGVAFENLPIGTYYQAAMMYYSGVKITLNSEAILPPNPE
jgi:hypothetical protein